MLRNIIANNKAVTLVETMMTVFIFMLVSGALYSTVVLGERSGMENIIKIEHQQEVRKAAERLKHDLSKSGSGQITGVPVGGASSSISFNVATGATFTGNPVWSSSITYALAGSDSNQLTRTQNGVAVIVANNISSIQFSRSVHDIVEVTVTGQYPDDLLDPDDQDRSIEKISATLSFVVHLRN
ncbi:MAG: hypothetical protein A2Y03_00775 [Omnitrophica WOR_2 bacterium GWF2_38_59]|nr:MAG: hypothetical protein A2Y06_03610 [Omnitrophica WOR_2 bacterium GWA2_37_7]OGX23977.1 MAG: hypothetical protein A2Y03_00775 [Omnitrophica WOR_2 bacterium GWF2_38_59]OGX46889.1 MAG: hypothetical protein A2243_11895 [Omnitrophica WOR_2 bacterium RIFOXYA2_FULL_38_17]OGX52602.1 MAG: hypothetical protein A2267_03795 [Omnitrophica WOR_2 bacterium RIFOXYA12_FULL_38_10]OGX55507.1 MAG: hypothetical protein A2447_05775 [Omnitrophica WOR_2 bacterium RIFOXYC2_FULL_38_12]OGX58508.1 MAG: hypothetical 